MKVGVLSDSVNEFGTGLAGSIFTGDLPSNVQVIQDSTSGGTDEGRAMLQIVHDTAPGASGDLCEKLKRAFARAEIRQM